MLVPEPRGCRWQVQACSLGSGRPLEPASLLGVSVLSVLLLLSRAAGRGPAGAWPWTKRDLHLVLIGDAWLSPVLDRLVMSALGEGGVAGCRIGRHLRPLGVFGARLHVGIWGRSGGWTGLPPKRWTVQKCPPGALPDGDSCG